MNITVGSSLPPTQMFTELRHAYLPHPKDICVGGCMGHGWTCPFNTFIVAFLKLIIKTSILNVNAVNIKQLLGPVITRTFGKRSPSWRRLTDRLFTVLYFPVRSSGSSPIVSYGLRPSWFQMNRVTKMADKRSMPIILWKIGDCEKSSRQRTLPNVRLK